TVTAASSTATMTAVSSSVNRAVFGQSVSFTAIISPQSGSGTPTGTVQFVIDGSNFGNPVTLGGGAATSNATSSLSVTSHSVTAAYSGDSAFLSSTGTLSGGQVVNLPKTNTAVSSAPNPSSSGQTVTF